MPWMRWYRGWRLQEERPEGDRVRIRVRFDVEDEAVMFALGFGAAVEIVDPPELRERVLRAARELVAALRADSSYGFICAMIASGRPSGSLKNAIHSSIPSACRKIMCGAEENSTPRALSCSWAASMSSTRK